MSLFMCEQYFTIYGEREEGNEKRQDNRNGTPTVSRFMLWKRNVHNQMRECTNKMGSKNTEYRIKDETLKTTPVGKRNKVEVGEK